jgi:hypothetical protein
MMTTSRIGPVRRHVVVPLIAAMVIVAFSVGFGAKAVRADGDAAYAKYCSNSAWHVNVHGYDDATRTWTNHWFDLPNYCNNDYFAWEQSFEDGPIYVDWYAKNYSLLSPSWIWVISPGWQTGTGP